MLLELFINILGYSTFDYDLCVIDKAIPELEITCEIEKTDFEFLLEVEKLDLEN